MRRILLVDDEPAVLEDLQRTLRPQRQQWDMAFAPSGEAALALLEAAPFDVIVSDMRMPRMDGLALLTHVRQRFPHMVRILFTNQTELETALRAVPVAHQFLAKPCDSNMLRVAVERACSLRTLLQDESIRRTVGAMGQLPSLPRVYDALTRALADPDASLADVARIVEQDVAISAKILQLVNSAFFGLAQPMTTVRSAVSYLGINILTSLIMSIEVFSVFKPDRDLAGSCLEALQQHAHLSSRIAAQLPTPTHLVDVATVAALLHDVGKLVLASKLPDRFAEAVERARRENCPLHTAEKDTLGVSHAEVGAYLLGLWGLPYAVVEAIAHHHAPTRVPHQNFDALAAVYVANLIAHERGTEPANQAGEVHEQIDLDYLDTLGVADQLPGWRATMATQADQAGETSKP